ncbi:hypothetical protein BYT27DRAFT_7222792 [Phlegmacium glaucopus]|nr:hypothetical protein BYT27DRAFT_7222792 [Phlegmacium glaucopus]
MVTSSLAVPSTQPSQLCEYCHQKPKFSNFPYCSKTCAGQAATLCNHCHKKPKFQNFDYCGKKCAAQATPAKPVNAGVAASGAQATGGSKPKGNSGANNQQQATQAFDPVQLAKLVAQHIPQVQAMFTPPSNQGVAPAAQVVPASTQSNNPFLNPINQAAYQVPPAAVPPQNAMTNGAVYSVASSNPLPVAQQLHISTQPSADDSECLIPGCGKPVHVDAKGVKTSDYCSMRHREEAVTLCLASPCIMCLALPQGETDYFCSRACREESMNKEKEYDDCSE